MLACAAETRNHRGKLVERKRIDLLGGQERILLQMEWDGRRLLSRTDEEGPRSMGEKTRAGAEQELERAVEQGWEDRLLARYEKRRGNLAAFIKGVDNN